MTIKVAKTEAENVEDAQQKDGVPESLVTEQYDKEAVAALVWKQDLRILPLSAFIYLLCYLDRSNIGELDLTYNAKVLSADTGNDLLTETGMSNYEFTIVLMVFLIAYTLFEVPSSYFLKKLRPNRWIALLMLSWGATTIGLGGATNYAQVTGIRFLLGVTEAGLFPGLVYYLTFWYRTSERSLRLALILASATLAGAFGGAIAYRMGYLNGEHEHSAWRWLFFIEGALSCASAILVWFLLPNYPESVGWLNDDEKQLAEQRLQVEGSKGGAKVMSWAEAKEVLTEWLLSIFGISTPFSSLSLFMPSITAGLGYENLKAQLMTVPPYAVAYVVIVVVAWSADHFNARGLHSARFSFIGVMGFLASAVLTADAYLQRYGCLIVGSSGAFSCIPPLPGWLSSNTHSTGGAGLAIALNISFGAPGRIVGVWIYKANEVERGYPTEHWTNAALLLFVSVGCVLLHFYDVMANRRRTTSSGRKRYAY
ncbi:hypothetical protein BDW74DRAFT_187139 [Aspergillus multicolor]|uniref:uncharacterized protein n=1 Tax=Aspergillus multicolor TaxID=41759 RepID=UPI003CCCAB5D